MSQNEHDAETVRQNAQTQSVLDHHLNVFGQGIEELMRDYGERSVLLTPNQTLRGAGEIRQFFARFLDGAGPEFWSAMSLEKVAVEGEIAYIAWTAAPFVSVATDTLLIRDGIILTQTFTSAPGE